MREISQHSRDVSIETMRTVNLPSALAPVTGRGHTVTTATGTVAAAVTRGCLLLVSDRRTSFIGCIRKISSDKVDDASVYEQHGTYCGENGDIHREPKS